MKKAREQAPGSVTQVGLTVWFFTFLNSSFMPLQKGVRKEQESLKTPQKQKKQNRKNKQNKTKTLKGGTEFGKMHPFWLLQVECDSC